MALKQDGMRFELMGLCFTSGESGLPFSHDPWLVALSYLTAAFGSYVALDMVERLRSTSGRARLVWHAGAAAALGGGIWSMHFIGMLAFRAAVPLSYDPAITAASLAIAIVFVAAGVEVVRRGATVPARLLSAGLLVGLGVAAMHYTGMAALRLPGSVAYEPLWFAASVAIAVAAASVALILAFALREAWQRAAAALAMAFAICGMHYTGMRATVILLDPLAALGDPVSQAPLATAVAAGTYGLLILALVAVFADRRLTAAAAREADRLRAINRALEQEVAERQRVEGELKVARDGLEQRVMERTRDLEDARARAEAASRAKSDFLANMSHELRTPLNAIIGFAELLEFNSAREPLTAKQGRSVEQIAKSGRHLLRLIDEVLDLARVEAGRLTLSLEAVEVAGVVDEVASTLQAVAEAAEVTIHVRGTTDAPPVLADRTRLAQVLSNLVSNAIKYNRRGGTVHVEIQRNRDGTAQISVHDTGTGIPVDRLSELFQPFNRLGREHGPIEGTGIGLTITKRIVEAMEGRIEVDSTPGVGSIFRVFLPIAAVRPVRAHILGLAEKETGTKARSLLYVEDNPSNIQLMQDLAEAVGALNLLVAADPLIGLDLARAHRPDVVVLDINLPGLDGFEVLKRLKADPATASIPVLALSANAMPRAVEKGIAAGFRRYLTKPIKIPEFLAALDEALEASDAA
jgi:diguanylate cyclase